MIAGKRQAIPVQAPCVYELEDIESGITEATADKLADNVYETISSTYSIGEDAVGTRLIQLTSQLKMSSLEGLLSFFHD